MAEDKKKKSAGKKKSAKSNAPKGSRWRSWAALMTVLLLVGAYLYAVNDDHVVKEDEVAVEKVEHYRMEKSGAGADADFTEKTAQVHQIVDTVLKKHEVSIVDLKKQKKSVKRQGVEGNISWTNRQIPVTGTAAQLDQLKENLAKILAKIDAQVLAVAEDTYEGKKATRIDIGIRDDLEGDTVTIIADKIYFMTIAVKEHINKAPPPKNTSGSQAKMALVIDDFGYTQESIDAYHEIDRSMTFAVLPNHPYSVASAKQGYNDGKQIILHLPMEAMGDDAGEEPQTIHVSMKEAEIRAMVRELTDSVPYLIGVNNHQGSRATSNQAVMNVVLNQLAEQGLFFVDSKTSGSSKAYDLAKQMGVPTAANELFIDNSSDINMIKGQLRKAADIARRNGKVIAIGHARPNTAKAIKAMIPELEAQGIRFVFVSTILE